MSYKYNVMMPVGADKYKVMMPVGANKYKVMMPELNTHQLRFASDTYIQLPATVVIDSTIDNTIEYEFEVNVDDFGYVWSTDLNGAPRGFAGPNSAGSTYQGARSNVADFAAFSFTKDNLHVMKEKYTASGATVQLEYNGADKGILSVANTAVANGIRIGGPSWNPGLSMVGLIRNFKIRDSGGTLIHHYPINTEVADGGQIDDIVGGQHGVLTLGTGVWEAWQ